MGQVSTGVRPHHALRLEILPRKDGKQLGNLADDARGNKITRGNTTVALQRLAPQPSANAASGANEASCTSSARVPGYFEIRFR